MENNALAELTVANLAAAEQAIDRLIGESGAHASFGVVRIELEPNSQLARLSAAEFARLVAEITRVLQAHLRSGDQLFTDHGWTWLIILPKLVSPTHLTLALIKLQQVLDENRDIIALAQGPILPVLGSAFYPQSANDAHGLLTMAKLASYEAWRSSERFRIELPRDDSETRHLSELATRIPAALQGDLLEIHLQPQLVTSTGECVSVEVLLRWRGEGSTWISPPLIIAAIERAGVRPAFNRWLIQRTARCLKALDAQGIVINYAINLVAADIHDPEIVDLVSQTLSTWEVDPKRITLEITETAMVRETVDTKLNLHQLKKLGVRLSLDDFGTAYSGMAYLRRMPIDELKIDQIFMRRIAESEKDREIVTSIIHLAHQLHIDVVAEGVETQEALYVLRSLDCDLVQGFHFSTPLSADDFATWWKNRAIGTRLI